MSHQVKTIAILFYDRDFKNGKEPEKVHNTLIVKNLNVYGT